MWLSNAAPARPDLTRLLRRCRYYQRPSGYHGAAKDYPGILSRKHYANVGQVTLAKLVHDIGAPFPVFVSGLGFPACVLS
jgi:hypothetical protein